MEQPFVFNQEEAVHLFFKRIEEKEHEYYQAILDRLEYLLDEESEEGSR